MSCPACGAGGAEVFYEVDRVPVHSCRLVGTPQEAGSFPTGELRLAVCAACGFVFNAAYDPALQDYSIAYEETQTFSPHFLAFMRELAAEWVDRYDLAGKQVLEIGSGKGEFLLAMVESGVGRGIGIDPGFVPERVSGPAAERIEFIADWYTERYGHLTGDAVVCRHTLEHIGPVSEFMRLIERSAGDAVLLFDLPDVLRVLREGAFWDIYYEHASYFSPGSLARLFRSTGYEVLRLDLAYDDQYILVEARRGEGAPLDLEERAADVVRAAEGFRDTFAATAARWRAELARADRPVIWGAGSKGVSFLTTLGITDQIELAVDVNPYKQGKFIAGTGQRVVAPEELRAYRPDLVIAMNPVYRGEIGETLAGLEVDSRLEAV